MILNFGGGAILPKRLVTNVPLPVNKWGGGGLTLNCGGGGGVGVGILLKKLFTNVPQMYKCKQKNFVCGGGRGVGIGYT